MDVFFSGCWSCRQVLREKSKPMCRVKLFFADSVESRISPAGEERGVCFHPQVTGGRDQITPFKDQQFPGNTENTQLPS